MFRKTIFWLHLSAGIGAGIFVFIMSLTGVLLAFEKQIKKAAASSNYPRHEAGAQLLTLEQLMAVQREAQPDVRVNALVVASDTDEPVSFRAGRAGTVALDTYTGTKVDVSTPKLDQFFRTVEDFHRWLNLSGAQRNTGRQINDVANAVFLFIVLSGLYLWLPPMMKAGLLKARVWLRGDYPNSKTRDYHWHHIFGIWMAIPLAVLVYTGMVMTYPWAANLMYRAFGAEIPAAPTGPGPGGPGGPPPGFAGGPPPGFAGGPPPGGFAGGPGPQGGGGEGRGGFGGPRAPVVDASTDVPAENWLTLDQLVQAAVTDPASSGWRHLTVTMPQGAAKTVNIEIDRGNGTQSHLRHTLTLDRQSGDVTARRTFADTPKAQQLRGIARFLHTGEVLGLWGQIVAALASAAALLLVWTGWALAYRRLIQPLFKR